MCCTGWLFRHTTMYNFYKNIDFLEFHFFENIFQKNIIVYYNIYVITNYYSYF